MAIIIIRIGSHIRFTGDKKIKKRGERSEIEGVWKKWDPWFRCIDASKRIKSVDWSLTTIRSQLELISDSWNALFCLGGTPILKKIEFLPLELHKINLSISLPISIVALNVQSMLATFDWYLSV